MLRFWRHVALPREDKVRKRWPAVPHLELWDIRICQECGHLVYGGGGQRAAQHYHDEVWNAIEGPEEWQDPGGIVIGGSDSLPPEMTGARPNDDDGDGTQ